MLAKTLACIIMFCVTCGLFPNTVLAVQNNRSHITELDDMSYAKILPGSSEQNNTIEATVDFGDIDLFGSFFNISANGSYILVVPTVNLVCIESFACIYKMDGTLQPEISFCVCEAKPINGTNTPQSYATSKTRNISFPEYTEDATIARPIHAYEMVIAPHTEPRILHTLPIFTDDAVQTDCPHTDGQMPYANQNCRHLTKHPLPANQPAYALFLPIQPQQNCSWSCDEITVGNISTIECRCE